ncbi:MAG TPA: hypothetical protein VGM88_09460 [Kofleriaceae bacterium]|jgi:hypothetical protein
MIQYTGMNGCGFEQHLRAVSRALTSDANVGFRRPDAALAVIVVADEDDCSLLDPQFLTSDSTTLGPLDSFRCTKFGVTCDQSLDEIGTKSNCKPDTTSVWLQSPQVTLDLLRSLQPNPGSLAVSMLVGPTEPFAIELRAPAAGQTAIPALAASCQLLGDVEDQVDDPGIRHAWLAKQLGSHGSTPDVCLADVSPALATAAATVRTALGISCVSASLTTAQCIADDGTNPVPACNGATSDCFDFVTDRECPGALRAIIKGGTLSSAAAVTIRCASGL